MDPSPVPTRRHNDLPWQLLGLFNNQLQDQRADLNKLNKTHTNIPKLKAGFVGGQVQPLVSHVAPVGLIRCGLPY